MIARHCLCAFVNDEPWVYVVASWCFIRLQLFDGRFKFFYCKVERQVAALESEVTFRDVQGAKSLSAFGKRPLFRSCEPMTFAVTGHLKWVMVLPVSLFMVCHALRLECVKSTVSTSSVHLALDTSSSL